MSPPGCVIGHDALASHKALIGGVALRCPHFTSSAILYKQEIHCQSLFMLKASYGTVGEDN